MSNIVIPSLLPYPDIFDVYEANLLGTKCFVYDDYKPGTLVVIKRFEDGSVYFRFGDWYANVVSPESINLNQHIPIIISVMHSIGLQQAGYYFDFDNILVDVRESINKFLSPGMMADLFGKLIPCAKSLELCEITNTKIGELRSLNKKYIIKSAKFQYSERDGRIVPAYGRIS